MKREITLNATVDELADSFCQLDSEEQSEFFAVVWRRMHEVCAEEKIKRPRSVILGADWQFWQIGRSAREKGMHTDAAEALGAMSAPLYVHTLMACGKL